MFKENIGIDIDGVICDIYPQAFKVLKEMYPKNVTCNEIDCNWEEAFNLSEEEVKNCFIECGRKGFFREAPLYKGCKEVLDKIKGRYNIFFVTWRNYIPNAKADTLYWLDSNKIPYHRLIIARNKFKIALREKFVFYLDDNTAQCNRTAKSNIPTYLFRRPGNKHDELDASVKVIKSWEEVGKLLIF